MRTDHDAEHVLAAHGICPGPLGYSRPQLAAAAAGRGWQVRTEEVPRAARWTRWRAIVLRPAETPPRHPAITRGRGPTPETALAAALAEALVFDDRGGA